MNGDTTKADRYLNLLLIEWEGRGKCVEDLASTLYWAEMPRADYTGDRYRTGRVYAARAYLRRLPYGLEYLAAVGLADIP
jgi:hypothetical protein